jgi:hypothetical protein
MRRAFPQWPWLVGTVAMLALVTALDGTSLAARTSLGQPLAGALTVAWWIALWLRAQPRLRLLMLVGLIAATAGEAIFSLLLGMYHYRLERIPLYVPPGHTILYAAIFTFVRQPFVRAHRSAVTAVFFAIGAGYSALWLKLHHDRYGFACFLAFALLVVAVRGARTFFASMYLLVAYLELCGTHFGAWRWPDHLLGRFIASGNPPSGVAVYYVLFDVSCLLLYVFARWASFERWISRLMLRRARAALD